MHRECKEMLVEYNHLPNAGLPHGELSRRITLVRRKKVIRRYQYSSPDIANYCESDIN